MTISLINRDQQDTLTWKGDKSGEYTIQSGYKFLIIENLHLRGISDTSQNLLTNYFARIWSLAILNKIKIHLWRVIHNYIPTLYNLQSRRLSCNATCLFYSKEVKTAEHIFRDCRFTQEIFQLLGVDTSHISEDQPWKDWLAYLFINSDL